MSTTAPETGATASLLSAINSPSTSTNAQASAPASAPESSSTTDKPAESASTTDETKDTQEYKGAGSKDALKADLADERNRRQAAEAKVKELAEFRAGLARLLGSDSKEPMTPEQAAAKLAEADTEISTLRGQLAVLSNAPDNFDAREALHDDRFRDLLKTVDLNDPKAVVKACDGFAKDNPRFLTIRPGAGSRDTTGGAQQQVVATSIDDLIRGTNH